MNTACPESLRVFEIDTYLWCCRAIHRGAKAYRAARAAVAGSAA